MRFSMEHFFWILLLVIISVFLYFLICYGYVSKGSLKSFALFYPALGGILVSLYYILTGPFISEDIVKKDIIETRNVYEFQTSHIPIDSKLLKNQIKNDLYAYRNSVFEVGDYFKHNSFKDDVDYLNVVELSFIKWLTSYFSESWSHIEGRKFATNYKKNKRKELFDKVITQNERLSFFEKTHDYKEYGDRDMLIPPNTSIEYEIEEDKHRYVIKSDLFELTICLFPMGIDNFRPELNDFHRFLLENNKTLKDENFVMKRTAISINLKLSKNINITDEKDFYEAFFGDFVGKLKKDFDWEYFEKIAKKVFADKTFYDAHFKSRDRLLLEEIHRGVMSKKPPAL